jgi:hypothetical protein
MPTTMPAEDVTITATWTINKYTITFNTEGGSEVLHPITQLTTAQQLQHRKTPTKEGLYIYWLGASAANHDAS